MILDILTVLFFVLGFALILWMVGERRRDVLHGPYVTKSSMARGNIHAGRLEGLAAREQPSQSSVTPSMPNVAGELSRIVREIEQDADLRGGQRRSGNDRRCHCDQSREIITLCSIDLTRLQFLACTSEKPSLGRQM
jgi:hypothetical protein